MDTIRKRPAPPPERCDATPEMNAVAQQSHPAQPLDLLFPVDSALPQVSSNPSVDEAQAPLPAYPPLFRRIRPRPRRLAAPASTSAPDWSLSAGAAVVLLGLAIAFGTYITLTQRDAMQSRLRRIVGQSELRASPRHDRAALAERTQELAQTLRNQIEMLRSRDAADAAAVADAAANRPASAHSSTLASSAPSLPAASSAAPASSKALAAKPLFPPLPSPAPRARQVANATPTRAHGTAATQPERRTVSTKHTNAACKKGASCAQANAPEPRKPTKVAAKPTPAKVSATKTATHSTKAKVPAKLAQHPVPTVVQSWSPPDSPAELPASDDTLIYRQH